MSLPLLNAIIEEYKKYYKEHGKSPKRLILDRETYYNFLQQIEIAVGKGSLSPNILGENHLEFWGMNIIKDFRQWRVE